MMKINGISCFSSFYPLLLLSSFAKKITMTTNHTFQQLIQTFPEQDTIMPVLFIGHGSPMNGIEDKVFSNQWAAMATSIPLPKAVIVISAHWQTRGTQMKHIFEPIGMQHTFFNVSANYTAMDFPPTIHDFGGFPEALYEVQYPPPGEPELAAFTKSIVHATEIGLDHEWGLDHGTWTVVRHRYPQAQIPVLQLSLDYTKATPFHFELANELQLLRKRGILIIGSGNMVHNLRMLNWQKLEQPGFVYDWAAEINAAFKSFIQTNNNNALIHYEQLGTAAKLAIPTPEHFLPLIYTLGLRNNTDDLIFFNDIAVRGSLTMTSVKFG
jgi:4,5-DOPA dioxygenase extradiol